MPAHNTNSPSRYILSLSDKAPNIHIIIGNCKIIGTYNIPDAYMKKLLNHIQRH